MLRSRDLCFLDRFRRVRRNELLLSSNWLGCRLGGSHFSGSSGRTGGNGRLELLYKVARKHALDLVSGGGGVLACVPVGIIVFNDGDDLAIGKAEVVLFLRVVLIHRPDFKGNGRHIGSSTAVAGEGAGRLGGRSWPSESASLRVI